MPEVVSVRSYKAHFMHSGKFSAERKFCKMWLADTNFPSEKNFAVENFQLFKSDDIFGKFSVGGKFLWVEMGLNATANQISRRIIHDVTNFLSKNYLWKTPLHFRTLPQGRIYIWSAWKSLNCSCFQSFSAQKRCIFPRVYNTKILKIC
jgi:hypothetical protein